MTTFAPSIGRFNGGYNVESFAAHVLGNIGSSYNISTLPKEPLEGIPWASHPTGFWNGTDHWEYIFLDSAPPPTSRSLSIYTNRIVKSTGICKTPPYDLDLMDELASIHLLDGNQTVFFPKIALGQESIYYLTKPILLRGGRERSCGPGCSNVKVLEPQAGPPTEGSVVGNPKSAFFFYDCNVTISSSTNQDLSPENAAVAAQAIALSGQFHQEFSSLEDENTQYVSYNFGLPFGEAQNNSATGMASLISRFAIGVIAAAAQTNPPMFVQGGAPAQGVRLKLESSVWFHLILAGTGSLQLILVLFSSLAVSRLVSPE